MVLEILLVYKITLSKAALCVGGAQILNPDSQFKVTTLMREEGKALKLELYGFETRSEFKCFKAELLLVESLPLTAI